MMMTWRELYQYPLHVMTVYPSTTDTDMMKTAVVEKMDSAEDVASATVKDLMQKQNNVIMGGKERDDQIRTNFLKPGKIDQFAAVHFEALENGRRTIGQCNLKNDAFQTVFPGFEH